jgi:hypothetical protein
MTENNFPIKGDLGKAFEKIKKEMFIEVNGCLVSHRSNHQFQWGGYTGSFPFIAEKIREARLALQNSIKQ